MDIDEAVVAQLCSQSERMIETHISWVFIRGDDVFKVKKPVRFPFLDYSTPALRRSACEAEVELNRRLSPDVYLGLVPVVRNERGFHFGGEGELVEWAVHMARLSDADRADLMLAEGRLGEAHLGALAHRVADFHAGCERDEQADGPGSVAQLQARFEETFEALAARGEDAARVDQPLRGLVRQHIERCAPLLRQRLGDGHVRDGHGDLRLEHVYFGADGRVRVLDCVEFERGFRVADVCADVAFLAMDLAYRGADHLAEHFIARYVEETGDHDLYTLVDLYRGYWALVRAKVAIARSTQLSPPVRNPSEAQAMIALAQRLLSRSQERPTLVAVGGIIGSGKSTVASHLSRSLGAVVLQSDRLRKFLAGVAPEQSLGEQPFAGAYAPARTRALYRELLHRAEVVLASGRHVIVDASMRLRDDRRALVEMARTVGARAVLVQCHASREVLRDRLEARQTHGSVSDARLGLLDAFAGTFEPVESGEFDQWLHLDTSGELQTTLAAVDAELGSGPAD